MQGDWVLHQVRSPLTRGQKAPTAAADNLAFAAHVGQLGRLQGARLSEVDGDLTQAPRCMDLGLEGTEGWVSSGQPPPGVSGGALLCTLSSLQAQRRQEAVP